jgi:hypothetical protein
MNTKNYLWGWGKCTFYYKHLNHSVTVPCYDNGHWNICHYPSSVWEIIFVLRPVFTTLPTTSMSILQKQAPICYSDHPLHPQCRNGLCWLIILPPIVGGWPHSFNSINSASAQLLHLLFLPANHICQISYRHLDMKWGSRLQYNLLAQTNQSSFIINILVP